VLTGREMARIHLLTANPASDVRAQGGYLSLLASARADRFKVHQLEDDPEKADLILFAEIDAGRLCGTVLKHPYVRRYRSKCFMFSSDWRVIPFLPGVYSSVEKTWYLPRRARPGFYPSCLMNPLVKLEPAPERDLLYSFMGDLQTASVRRVLSQLDHGRGSFVDTSKESQAVMWKGTPEERAAFWNRYVDIARRSKFILCPRGLAPSSIRLFETMCMGRVPVILSDEWMPPLGPRWENFSIRIAERDAPSLISILEEKEADSHAMGLAARQEWEEYFSQEVMFHRVVELCLEINQARRLPEWLARQEIIPQLLRKHVVREYLRTWNFVHVVKRWIR
jgi:hypothetical protein